MLFLEGKLPQPLVEYLEATYDSELSTSDISVAIVSLTMLLLGIFSSIGLYRLKKASRNLFIGVNVLMLFLSPLYGPVVIDTFSYAFDGLAEISAGFIIAMSYMTDVLEGQQSQEESA